MNRTVKNKMVLDEFENKFFVFEFISLCLISFLFFSLYAFILFLEKSRRLFEFRSVVTTSI